MKNARLFTVLQQSAEADKQRALMSLELLAEHPAGIGDHSTEDFYKNAEEALEMLAAAEDRLEALDRHFPIEGGVRIVEDGAKATGS
ncbi:MAG: hypothetical protein AAGG46_04300 [Planctomycetota bacterium]